MIVFGTHRDLPLALLSFEAAFWHRLLVIQPLLLNLGKVGSKLKGGFK